MGFGPVSCDDLHFHGLADVPDEVASSDRHLSGEYRLAVCGHPHEMILHIIDSMGCFVVMFRTASLLKSRVFLPFPEKDHDLYACLE